MATEHVTLGHGNLVEAGRNLERINHHIDAIVAQRDNWRKTAMTYVRMTLDFLEDPQLLVDLRADEHFMRGMEQARDLLSEYESRHGKV